MDISKYPKEWQTNKNLRWWLACRNDDEIVSTDEDKYIHEVVAVEFAKQFHREDMLKLKEENKKLREALMFYADRDNWRKQNQSSYTICPRIDKEYFVLNNLTIGGKKARQCLEEIDSK